MYRVNIDDLLKATETCVIDIRNQADYEKETWDEALHIYWEEFALHEDMLSKEKRMILICYTGEKSDELAEEYQAKGYDMYSLEGGYRSIVRYKLQQFMENQKAAEDKSEKVERSIVKKFRKEIWRKFTKAINEYELIKDGDKVAVCISGGKDSMLMAKLFQELLRHGKQNFEAVFLVMNPGYNDINYQTTQDNARLLNVPIHVFQTDIFNVYGKLCIL